MPRKWTKKEWTAGCVRINIKNRTIEYNPQETWIRYETQDIIYIYGAGTDAGVLKCENCGKTPADGDVMKKVGEGKFLCRLCAKS